MMLYIWSSLTLNVEGCWLRFYIVPFRAMVSVEVENNKSLKKDQIGLRTGTVDQ